MPRCSGRPCHEPAQLLPTGFAGENIAFATDTPAGLLAPVIKAADKKSLLEIATAISELARKAREGRFTFSDCEGRFLFPILEAWRHRTHSHDQSPEVAVLGIGCARQKVIVIDGQFRLTLPLTLTYDHRVLEGAIGGRFMQSLRQALVSPETFPR